MDRFWLTNGRSISLSPGRLVQCLLLDERNGVDVIWKRTGTLVLKWRQAELDEKRFAVAGQVYPFVVRMMITSVIIADGGTVLIHLVLDFFGVLPYPIWQAIIIGCLASTIVASSVSGFLFYNVGNLLRDLSASRSTFEKLSSMDMLSGLKNRRAFFARAEVIRDNAIFVLMDIDRFKSINDVYGHVVGDEVIKLVGGALLNLPSDDVIETGRIGGEEFAMIVHAPMERAMRVVEMARLAVATIGIPSPSPVTISAGVANICPGREIAEAYRAADSALYVAKAAGRDRIVREEEIGHFRSRQVQHAHIVFSEVRSNVSSLPRTACRRAAPHWRRTTEGL